MKIFAKKSLIFRAICFTIYGPKMRYFCEISFTKHFQKSQNVMPVRVCITRLFMAAYGDCLCMHDSVHILDWDTLSKGILSHIWSELAPIFAILS